MFRPSQLVCLSIVVFGFCLTSPIFGNGVHVQNDKHWFVLRDAVLDASFPDQPKFFYAVPKGFVVVSLRGQSRIVDGERQYLVEVPARVLFARPLIGWMKESDLTSMQERLLWEKKHKESMGRQVGRR